MKKVFVAPILRIEPTLAQLTLGDNCIVSGATACA